MKRLVRSCFSSLVTQTRIFFFDLHKVVKITFVSKQLVHINIKNKNISTGTICISDSWSIWKSFNYENRKPAKHIHNWVRIVMSIWSQSNGLTGSSWLWVQPQPRVSYRSNGIGDVKGQLEVSNACNTIGHEPTTADHFHFLFSLFFRLSNACSLAPRLEIIKNAQADKLCSLRITQNPIISQSTISKANGRIINITHGVREAIHQIHYNIYYIYYNILFR